MSKTFGGLLLKLRNHFFTGVIVLLPLLGTIVIIQFFFSLLDDKLLEPLLTLIRPNVAWADVRFLTVAVKVVLFIIILISIVLLGMLVRSFFIRQLINIGEGILLRVPIVNKIYSTIQQMSRTFLMRKKDIFNKVVLVEYPRKGIYIMGLFTSETKGSIAKELPVGCVNVFIPTTPNPTSGFLIMVPRSEIKELDLSVEDAMKIIVSGGVLTSNETRFDNS